MEINKLREFLNRTKSSMNIRAIELKAIEMESIIFNGEGLLLDIKQELIKQERRNIEELIKICNKYESELEEETNE
jgi:hypothetical protein